MPSDEEEEELESVLINNIASDQSDNQFSFAAIEAENSLVEDSENKCSEDQSDYCQAQSVSENSFKSPNHTMCKYCVSLFILSLLLPIC